MKNSILYHGSKTPGIKTLKPFVHNGVDSEAVVFASSDRRFALAMIHGTGNDIAIGYFVNMETHEEEMYVDELQKGAFALLDAPGILYEVPADGFILDSRLSHVEYISKKETPVISEIPVENILEELKKDSSISFVPYDKVLETMAKRGKNPASPSIAHKADRFN